MLLPSKPAVRRAVFVVVILGSAAAVAAMWDSFAPPNACLFCSGPEQYTATLGGAAAPAEAGGGVRSDLRAAGKRAEADMAPLPGMPPAIAYNGDGGSGRSAGSRSGWQPWGNGSDSRGFNASGSGGPSVGMGGLWRLMTLAHRSHEGGIGGGSSSTKTHTPRAARSSPGARPGPRPAPAPSPASPTASAPTNPFDGHADGPSNPFVPPAPGGALDPGGAGGTHSGGGGSAPSANPEPASILLIGTGLLALVTELRRRRAI